MTEPLRMVLVERDKLDAAWPRVAPLLARALERSEGELDLAQLRLLAVLGRVEIIAALRENDAVKAAWAVEYIDFPNYRVANIVAIGGREVFAHPEAWQQFKAWLKSERGCSKVQGYCPASVARLWLGPWSNLGMHEAYRVVRADL